MGGQISWLRGDGENLPVLALVSKANHPPPVELQTSPIEVTAQIAVETTVDKVSVFPNAGPVTVNAPITAAGRDVVSNFNNYYHHHHYHSNSLALDPEKVREILNWLAPAPNYRAIHKDTYDKRTLGTGEWFTKGDEFKGWLKSNGGMLWGYGMPGAGKTVLASIVINHVEVLADASPETTTIAYAYCRYSEKGTTVRQILAALVRQLLERNQSLINAFERTLARHKRENTHPSQDELIEMLVAISSKYKVKFFILDGLDEAPTDVRFRLVDLISRISGHFIITSRPLDLLKSTVPYAIFIPIVAHKDDIRKFVAGAIRQNVKLAAIISKDEGLKESIISKICTKSGGMFLHATLQVEMLCHCTDQKTLLERLEELPVKVKDLYRQSIERIDMQSEEDKRIAYQALIWLLYGRKSFSIQELQYAIANCAENSSSHPSGITNINIVVSACCGLVTVDNEGSLVRLVHYTARESLWPYLMKHKPPPHALIMKSCLNRISQCNLPSSTLTTKSSLAQLFNDNPLLRYSYDHWHVHARQCYTSPGMSDIIHQFVQTCRSFPWFEEDRPWVDALQDDPILDHLNPIHMNAAYALPIFVQSKPDTTLDTNVPTSISRRTPLMLASIRGHDVTVDALVELPGIDVNAVDKLGQTALMLASEFGRKTVVEQLLDINETRVNSVDNKGRTALMLASRYGEDAIVMSLLRRDLGEGINIMDHDGRTALMIASLYGREPVVKQLLKSPGCEVNLADNDGRTALILASERGQTAVVIQLLSVPGIEVDVTDNQGRTALMLASELDQEATVDRLLDFPGIQINVVDKRGRSALMLACSPRYGRKGVLAHLLDMPSLEVNLVDEYNQSALMLAAESGREAAVEQLLKVRGIEVNLVDRDGRNALMLASLQGRTSVVKTLLNVPGIAFNSVDNYGWTALMTASCHGEGGVVRELLQVPGVDINVADNEGRTASTLASDLRQEGVLAQFLDGTKRSKRHRAGRP